jgi:hypothetical protein
MLVLAPVLWLIVSTVVEAEPIHPVVYWVSTPVRFNETVVVAGAGLANGDQVPVFCRDAQCTETMPSATEPWSVWNSSVQVRACMRTPYVHARPSQ